MTAESLVVSDPEILGGTPVFKGTRVPVRTLFEYLADGLSLEYFLESFPSVTREQAAGMHRDRFVEKNPHAATSRSIRS
jgi:uncharacterized protein (DUF433 family)